jgi:hypothetical protein
VRTSNYNEPLQERTQRCGHMSQDNGQSHRERRLMKWHASAYMGSIYFISPEFDPQWNEEEIAMERLQQVHISSVDVEVTEDLFEIDGTRPPLVFEDPSSDFYGLPQSNIKGK